MVASEFDLEPLQIVRLKSVVFARIAYPKKQNSLPKTKASKMLIKHSINPKKA